MHSPDIVCVTETWLHNDIPDGVFCPRQYNVIRYDRGNRGGGVALFVRNGIKYAHVEIPKEFNNVEILCADIKLGDQSVRIIGYYRSGGFDKEATDYMTASVKCLKKLCSTANRVLLLGDFNLPEIDWNYYRGPDNVIYNSFIYFVNSYGLSQCVNQPTRGNNILDLVLSSGHSLIKDFYCLPPIGVSDHNVVVFTPNISNLIHNVIDDGHEFYSWKNADYTAINEYLLSIDWNIIFQTCFNVQMCWSAFMSILNYAMSKFVPKVRIKGPQRSPRWK